MLECQKLNYFGPLALFDPVLRCSQLFFQLDLLSQSFNKLQPLGTAGEFANVQLFSETARLGLTGGKFRRLITILS
jgi:hypothetical protein